MGTLVELGRWKGRSLFLSPKTNLNLVKALVYHSMRDVRVDTVEDPKIEDGRDVTIRVTSTATRGFGLHIYNGRLPQLRPWYSAMSSWVLWKK